jgi:hypothetical protein
MYIVFQFSLVKVFALYSEKMQYQNTRKRLISKYYLVKSVLFNIICSVRKVLSLHM